MDKNIFEKLKNFALVQVGGKLLIKGVRMIEQLAGSNFSSKFTEDKIEFIKSCNEKNQKNTNPPLEIIQKDQIDADSFDWNHRQFEPLKLFPGEGDKEREITISYLHKGNKSNDKSLIIIPGFSDNSFSWTIGRINQFFDKLNEKYTDIYIFDNSSIGKIPNELEKDNSIPQPSTYEEIVKVYLNLFEQIGFQKTIDVLGRSAGGGVAMMLSLNQPIINELYLASSGFDFNYMKDKIKGSIQRKVIISHSINDMKIKMDDSDGCFNLYALYYSAGFSPELVIVRTSSSEDGKEGWLNHRIHPELIFKIVE